MRKLIESLQLDEMRVRENPRMSRADLERYLKRGVFEYSAFDDGVHVIFDRKDGDELRFDAKPSNEWLRKYDKRKKKKRRKKKN